MCIGSIQSDRLITIGSSTLQKESIGRQCIYLSREKRILQNTDTEMLDGITIIGDHEIHGKMILYKPRCRISAIQLGFDWIDRRIYSMQICLELLPEKRRLSKRSCPEENTVGGQVIPGKYQHSECYLSRRSIHKFYPIISKKTSKISIRYSGLKRGIDRSQRLLFNKRDDERLTAIEKIRILTTALMPELLGQQKRSA